MSTVTSQSSLAKGADPRDSLESMRTPAFVEGEQ